MIGLTLQVVTCPDVTSCRCQVRFGLRGMVDASCLEGRPDDAEARQCDFAAEMHRVPSDNSTGDIG